MKEKQLDMFTDICARKHKGNPYSVAANKAVAPKKKPIRERVFLLIQSRPGLTCEEIEVILNLKHQTVSARLSELARDGRVKIIGEAKTTSGCTAATYGV